MYRGMLITMLIMLAGDVPRRFYVVPYPKSGAMRGGFWQKNQVVTGNAMEGASMEDEIGLIKKRKKDESLALSPIAQTPICRGIAGLVNNVKRACGPTFSCSGERLGWSGYSLCAERAICLKKNEGIVSRLDDNRPKNEISGVSLRDSNIENMNRLFLSILNRVSVEEIWEVRKKLGVKLTERDTAVIQHNKELQS
ncbi:hypothetical protein Ancab_029646 [Ancistrocladus abbreviatus]